MTLIVDTVGKITLPSGETCQGVILTGSPDAVRAAGRHWAGRVTIQSAEIPAHVAAAAEKAAARAAQAVETDTRGALAYRGWRIAQNPFRVWQYQSEEITGDNDPGWMSGSASSLFDAMDAIDDAIDENMPAMEAAE